MADFLYKISRFNDTKYSIIMAGMPNKRLRRRVYEIQKCF